MSGGDLVSNLKGRQDRMDAWKHTSNGGSSTGVLHRLVTDHEGVGLDLPESLGGIDGCPVELAAGEGGLVDGTELVLAGGVVLQVGGEERLVEHRHDVGEEGLLLLGLDGVELAESETDETVVHGVLSEGLRDGSGLLDGLVGNGGTTDVHGISSDDACSTRAIAVGDLPGSTCHRLERGGFLGDELGMLSKLRLRHHVCEDPAVEIVS